MVTMQEIADRVGVHRATVSNVLNGRLRAERSDAARRAAEIRRVATEMGYRVNLAARATRTGRTGCIGMLSSPRVSYSVHFGGFEQALVEAMERRGLLLVKGLLSDEMLADNGHLPRIVAESLADGLIINYALHIPAGITRMIERHALPAVWINSKQPHDCVHPDDLTAAREATTYLIHRGHRRILYAYSRHDHGEVDIHYSVIDRRAGYEQAMCNAGLPPRRLELSKPPGDPYPGHVHRFSHEVLNQRDSATAIVFNGPGQPLLLAAAERRLRVPEDLSVISFENEQSGHADFHMTRALVPFARVAQEATRMLCHKIDRGNRPHPPVAVRYGVEEGVTVSRPHQAGARMDARS